jgi:hypothetical protein
VAASNRIPIRILTIRPAVDPIPIQSDLDLDLDPIRIAAAIARDDAEITPDNTLLLVELMMICNDCTKTAADESNRSYIM